MTSHGSLPAILCTILIVLAGCTYSGGPPDEQVVEYLVAAHQVDSPPEDATVIPANDSRIRDVEAIQRVLSIAAEKNGAQISVSKETYENVTDALAKTPLYKTESRYSAERGLYVDYNGTVIRVGAYSARGA